MSSLDAAREAMAKSLDPLAWVRDPDMTDAGYERRRKEARLKIHNALASAQRAGFVLQDARSTKEPRT